MIDRVLGLPAAAFDAVGAFQVLEQAEPMRCLAAGAALAPGGELFVGFADRDRHLAAAPDLVLNAPPHHPTRWSGAGLENAIARTGLAVVEVARAPVEARERTLAAMTRLAPERREDFGGGPQRAVVRALAAAVALAGGAPRGASGATRVVRARRPQLEQA